MKISFVMLGICHYLPEHLESFNPLIFKLVVNIVFPLNRLRIIKVHVYPLNVANLGIHTYFLLVINHQIMQIFLLIFLFFANLHHGNQLESIIIIVIIIIIIA